MRTETLLHKFDIETYHQLISAGILHEDDRVELIEGRIVDMTPIGSRHSACVKRLNNFFSQKLHGRAIVSVQDPIQLSKEQSEPQPDIALLRYRDDFYSNELPGAENILLLIEVADTSLEYDRETKIPLYAKAQIQEVWLLNLPENCIELYSSPSPEGYEIRRIVRHNEAVSPKSFPDINVTADHILGE